MPTSVSEPFLYLGFDIQEIHLLLHFKMEVQGKKRR